MSHARDGVLTTPTPALPPLFFAITIIFYFYGTKHARHMPATRTITVLNQDSDTCRELAEILAEHNIIVMEQHDNIVPAPRLILNDLYNVCRIDFDYIICIKASGNLSEVYFVEGHSFGKMMLFSKTLGSIQDMLPSSIFVRSHQSWLVNINHVEKLCVKDSPRLLLAQGLVALVSENNLSFVKQAIKKS